MTMTQANPMHNPTHLLSLVRLFRLVQSGADLNALVQQAVSQPEDANLMMSLSMIFSLTGQRDAALELQSKALQRCQLYHVPASRPATMRLLVLMRTGDMMDNTPIDFLLEHSSIAMDWLYVSAHQPLPAQLPPHDALFIAIGESTANRPLLDRLSLLVAHWPQPVINAPHAIIKLARHQLYTELAGIPGLVIPATRLAERATVFNLAQQRLAPAAVWSDGCYPFIIRPLDAHAGHGLARIDTASALQAYLADQQDSHFYLANYINYRSADGLFRKYRLALCQGRPYACHMAISDHWLLHFKNANMEQDADKRAEEARFMCDFEQQFAARHAAALLTLAERIGLDYVIIDCAETPQGKLLIFELDNRGFVHAIDAPELFPYKAPVMQHLFDAFHTMLLQCKLTCAAD